MAIFGLEHLSFLLSVYLDIQRHKQLCKSTVILHGVFTEALSFLNRLVCGFGGFL